MWSLLKDTAASWSNHKAVRLAAAAGLPTPGSTGRPGPTLQFRTHDLPATLWQAACASNLLHGSVGCWWSLPGGDEGPCPTSGSI